MQSILQNFKNLSQIPHCSYETEELKNFLSAYAKEKGFKVSIDKAGNIHCIKGNPKICLQSHYDMVCMGNAPKIELYEEEVFLKAKNSSLGADNGMGVAIMMKMMNEFNHLECLFTNDEEVGLIGAKNLEHRLKSKMLLNLDHEDEKDIIIGCAGGVDIKAILPFECEKKFGELYELEAVNFKGGHSGIDIVKNSKNSIKEMAKFIKENQGLVVFFEGGERINSIPKHAKALVHFKNKPKENQWIKCQFLEEKEFNFCKQSKLLLNAINAFAQGIRSYNLNLNIVQSSINLSLLRMHDEKITIELFARANFLEDLKELEFQTLEFFKAFDFKVQSYNFYPPWEGKNNALSDEVFKILSQIIPNPKISAIHAGLECGIIEKNQKILCCSIGPNIYNPHSTNERCELASVEKISQVVFEVLKNHQ